MNRTREASYCSEPVPVISSDRNRAFVRRSLSPFVARADLGNGVERSRSWSTRQRSYLDDEDEKDDEVFQQQEAETMTDKSRTPSVTQSFLGADPIFRLQDHINIYHLEQLMNTFHLAGTGLQGYDITARTGTMDEAVMRRGYLTLMEFRQALVEILGPAVDKEQMEMLFMKVDTTCDGLVDWDEFCTYFLLQLQEMNNTHDKWTMPFDEEPSRIVTNHFSKEVAVRTMFCSNPNRIITVSKDGAISTWSTDLKLQRSVVMEVDPVFSVSRMSGGRRRNRLWVTDCVVMNNCNKLVVGTTSRDIWFYDMACAQYTCQYRLFDIPNVPLCFDYWYDEKNPAGTSLLLYGDDSGNVVVFYFLTPQQHLFEPGQRADDKTIQIYMQDLSHHSKYMQYSVMPSVHTDWVRQICFMPSSNSFITCSASPVNSMSIRDIERKKKAYVFKLRKGISCFDYNRTWNVIATGSVDHVVRLWNPVSTLKPMALLKGHVTSVLDVLIHEELGQVISYSQDLTLKTWDLREYFCIQSVSWKYPTTKQPDHGASVFFLSPLASNMLVLSCNHFMAEFRLRGVGRRSLRISTTHNSSICSVLYNPSFKQVVTGCEESVVAVWEIDTGQRVLQLSNVHGESELTAVAMDAEGQRIFTGSRNGNIKIWNFSNGHCLKNLVAKVPGEVTAILHFPEKRQILAAGWSQILTGYTDSQETFHSGPSDSWTAGHAHKDDILTADYCPPCYLATGSFDGEIIIWTTETEKSLRRLRTVPSEMTISHSDRGITSKQLDKHSCSGAQMSNVTTGLRSQHTLAKSRQISQSTQTQASSRSTLGFRPVYKVLFLTERAKAHNLDSAILVSVDGPDAHFWHLFNNQMPVNTATGTLRVAHYEDATIHALATDSDNKFLIAGDSSGYVSVWNIEHYCINNDQASLAYPVMVQCWRAHSGIVTEVMYAGHEYCPLLVSGSDDGSVRLWNMKGHFIGTFGQGVAWIVSDPLTYQHPLNPFGETMKISETQLSRPGSSRPVTAKTETGERLIRSAVSAAARKALQSSISRMDSKNPADNTTENTQERSRKDDFPVTMTVQSTTSVEQSEELYSPAAESILGEPYLRHYNRRMKDRQQRRDCMGDIDMKQALRFGTLCSPFQALQTPPVEEIHLPRHLPTVLKLADHERSQF